MLGVQNYRMMVMWAVTRWRYQRMCVLSGKLDVGRVPSPRAHHQVVKAVEDAWRAELPDDGDVGRHEVAVPEDVRAQWEADAAEQEFVRRDQPHLTFLAGDPKLGLLRAMEHFDEDTQVAEAGALMTQNVVEYRPRPDRAESVADAIAISLDETRRIDVDRVGDWWVPVGAGPVRWELVVELWGPELGEWVSECGVVRVM